jgi:hypothetical protein
VDRALLAWTAVAAAIVGAVPVAGDEAADRGEACLAASGGAGAPAAAPAEARSER